MKTLRIFIAVLLMVNFAYSGEFHVDKDKKNSVKFRSKAPIEDFDGITGKIDGFLFSEGDNLLEKSELYFEVDLNSIDTGIGLRNRHMRENYLETDKFPYAYYVGKLVKAESANENVINVTAEGTMFIHGERNPLTVTGILTKEAAGFRIKTDFKISLTDYKIKIPKLMMMKLNEVVDLNLNFYLKKIDKNRQENN